MSWFRELFTLLGMLFNRTTLSEPKIIVMKHFPFRGYSAMMWCGSIVTRDENYVASEVTLRHERIHLLQAYFYKRYISYYLRYAWQWLKGNPLRHPASSAYYTNPFEMEAYGNENLLMYYPEKHSWKHYAIRKRKSTYKRHRNDWKGYCISLAEEVRP